MIVLKEFPDKKFTTKAEAFRALKDNKEELKSLKMATVKMADAVPMLSFSKTKATKSLIPKSEVGYGSLVYPVINTTKLIDSHRDLHLDGMWNKSATEQTGKTYLIINHDLSVGKVISQPKDVNIIVKSIPWKDLGFDYEGSTEALIFESKLTEKSNKDGFLAYKDNDPVEHSVRMQYVKIKLAVNSDEEDFKEEKAEFDKHYPIIANKEVADEIGYFWAVYEAKIYKEGSMVLAGSNHATPTLYDLKEPGNHSNTEPSKDTRFKVADALRKTKFNF